MPRKKKGGGHGNRWTEWEDEIVMAKTRGKWDDTMVNIAERLNRTPRAVAMRRVKLSKGPRKNAPWHGTIGGYTNHNCRCRKCRNAWASYITAWRLRKAS